MNIDQNRIIFLGAKTYEVFLFINGALGTILLEQQ